MWLSVKVARFGQISCEFLSRLRVERALLAVCALLTLNLGDTL